MSKLKPCPCGKVPSQLIIEDIDHRLKWKNIYPDCCGFWVIEAKMNYELDEEKQMQIAEKAWHQSPRGFDNNLSKHYV